MLDKLDTDTIQMSIARLGVNKVKPKGCSDFALTLLLRECFQVPWTFIKLETFFKQFIPSCVEVE